MSKKVLSYKDQVKYEYFINGVLWLLAGILSIPESNVCALISAIFLVCAGVFTVRGIICKKEKEDEMAEAHINEAKAVSFSAGQIMLIALSLVIGDFFGFILKKPVDISNYISEIVFIIVGIQNIIVGLEFKSLEEE